MPRRKRDLHTLVFGFDVGHNNELVIAQETDEGIKQVQNEDTNTVSNVSQSTDQSSADLGERAIIENGPVFQTIGGSRIDEIREVMNSAPFPMPTTELITLDNIGSVDLSNKELCARLVDAMAAQVQAEDPLKRKHRPVIVCTTAKGVFHGWIPEGPGNGLGQTDTYISTEADRVFIRHARMAIYWNTTDGLFELCSKGPNPDSKISATVKAGIELRGISAVIECDPLAAIAWEKYSALVANHR